MKSTWNPFASRLRIRTRDGVVTPRCHDALVEDDHVACAVEREDEAMDTSVTVDCQGCRGKELDACKDCVVTFILGREPEDAIIIDVAEARAVRMLGKAGLVPPLRYERTADGGTSR